MGFVRRTITTVVSLTLLGLMSTSALALPSRTGLTDDTLIQLVAKTTAKVSEIQILGDMAMPARARITPYGGTERELIDFVLEGIDREGSIQKYENWLNEQKSISLLDWHKLMSDLDFMIIPNEGASAELSPERLGELRTLVTHIEKQLPENIFYKKIDARIPQEFFKQYPASKEHLEPISNIAISDQGLETMPQLAVTIDGKTVQLGQWGIHQYVQRQFDFRIHPDFESDKKLNEDAYGNVRQVERWIRYLSENPDIEPTPQTKEAIRGLLAHVAKSNHQQLISFFSLDSKSSNLGSKIRETLEKLQLYSRNSAYTRQLLDEYGISDIAKLAGSDKQIILTPLAKVPTQASEWQLTHTANYGKPLGREVVVNHRTSLPAAQNISKGALWISNNEAIIQGKITGAGLGPGLYAAEDFDSLDYGDFAVPITLSANAIEGKDFIKNGSYYVILSTDAIARNADGSLKIGKVDSKALAENLLTKFKNKNLDYYQNQSIVRALAAILNPEIDSHDYEIFKSVLGSANGKEQSEAFLQAFLSKPNISNRISLHKTPLFNLLFDHFNQTPDALNNSDNAKLIFSIFSPQTHMEDFRRFGALMEKMSPANRTIILNQMFSRPNLIRESIALKTPFLKTYIDEFAEAGENTQNRIAYELMSDASSLPPELRSKVFSFLKTGLSLSTDTKKSDFIYAIALGIPKKLNQQYLDWLKTLKDECSPADYEAIQMAYLTRKDVQERIFKADIEDSFANRSEMFKATRSPTLRLEASSLAKTLLERLGTELIKTPETREALLDTLHAQFNDDFSFEKKKALKDLVSSPEFLALPESDRLNFLERLTDISTESLGAYPWDLDNPKEFSLVKKVLDRPDGATELEKLTLEIHVKYPKLQHITYRNVPEEFRKPWTEAERARTQSSETDGLLGALGQTDLVKFGEKFPGTKNPSLYNLRLGYHPDLFYPYGGYGENRKVFEQLSSVMRTLGSRTEERLPTPEDFLVADQIILAGNVDFTAALLSEPSWQPHILKLLNSQGVSMFPQLLDLSNSNRLFHTDRGSSAGDLFKRRMQVAAQVIKDELKENPKLKEQLRQAIAAGELGAPIYLWDKFPWDFDDPQDRNFLIEHFGIHDDHLIGEFKAIEAEVLRTQGIRIGIGMKTKLIEDPEIRARFTRVQTSIDLKDRAKRLIENIDKKDLPALKSILLQEGVVECLRKDLIKHLETND